MSDDPFDLSDDDEVSTEAESNAKRNRELAEMRKAAKELKNILPELEELRAFKAEQEKATRQTEISGAFQALGLNPKHAEFYQGEDATPEAIKAWAVEKDFLQPDENATPAPPPATTGFTPTVFEGTSAVGTKMYSAEELATLLRTNPAQAEAIYKAGRLKKEEPDWDYSSRLYGRDT